MGRPKSVKKSAPRLWKVYRRFWPWIGKQRSQIGASLAALFVGVLLQLLEPWPLKFVIDRVIATDRPQGLHTPAFIENLDSMTLLTIAAVLLVVISALRAFAGYCQAVGFARIANRVLRQIRDHVFRHMQGLSLSFHAKSRGGDLIVRVTRDVSMLRDVSSTAVLPMVGSVMVITGMFSVMIWLQWRLALLAIATVPFFWLTTVRISRRIHEAASKQRRREGAMASTAAESITAIKIVQALSLEGIFAADFAARNNKSQKEELKAARLSARLGRTVDVLLAISTAMVLWYGARLVMGGQLTPGDLLVFLTYLKRSFKPAQDFAKYTARLAKATAAGERVIELLDRTPDVQDRSDAVPAPAFAGAVRFEHVEFAYEPGHPVLHEIDLEVRPGEHIALAGQSGDGKSTLVSLILRLYDPTTGQVLIDDHDITDYTIASVRSQISVVLQDSILFAATVWENISYGAADSTREEIIEAAKAANAHEFIEALPDGYDTVLAERGVTLSHGQRQRIAIARAAIRRTPILILDEPTTGLDEKSEQTVIEALERLAVGRTTFLITHNLQLAARADRILHLADGRLTESGTHDELMQADGRYAALYRLQSADLTETLPEKPRVLIP